MSAIHDVIRALEQGEKYQNVKYLIHRAHDNCTTAQELIDYLFRQDLWEYDNDLAMALQKYVSDKVK
jgi:hypothetical protein